MKYLLIAVFGGAGSLARYLAGTAISSRLGPRFPWGTLVVNVTGSFLIGLILTLLTERMAHPNWRLALVVGFLGGHDVFELRVGIVFTHPRGRLLDGRNQYHRQRELRIRRGMGRCTPGAASAVATRTLRGRHEITVPTAIETVFS